MAGSEELIKTDRVYKEYNTGEVEDVMHWLVRCPAWRRLRESLRSHFTAKPMKKKKYL